MSSKGYLLAELGCASVASKARAVDASRTFACGVARSTGHSEGAVVSALSGSVHFAALELLATLRILVGAVAWVANSSGFVGGKRRFVGF